MKKGDQPINEASADFCAISLNLHQGTVLAHLKRPNLVGACVLSSGDSGWNLVKECPL